MHAMIGGIDDARDRLPVAGAVAGLVVREICLSVPLGFIERISVVAVAGRSERDPRAIRCFPSGPGNPPSHPVVVT
jgi:hypothetical protein